ASSLRTTRSKSARVPQFLAQLTERGVARLLACAVRRLRPRALGRARRPVRLCHLPSALRLGAEPEPLLEDLPAVGGHPGGVDPVVNGLHAVQRARRIARASISSPPDIQNASDLF